MAIVKINISQTCHGSTKGRIIPCFADEEPEQTLLF
jgi:hypothetical protein